jgi:rod shape-determining protein MreD
MNRRLWAWPVLGFLILILQSTAAGTFSGQIWFDLPLLFVYNISMLEGANVGALSGFIFGLIQDILTGGIFGFHILTRTLVGFGSGSFKELVYRNNYPYHALIIFIISMVLRILLLVPQYFLGRWLGGTAGAVHAHRLVV